jgi:hypothetical protein
MSVYFCAFESQIHGLMHGVGIFALGLLSPRIKAPKLVMSNLNSCTWAEFGRKSITNSYYFFTSVNLILHNESEKVEAWRNFFSIDTYEQVAILVVTTWELNECMHVSRKIWISKL